MSNKPLTPTARRRIVAGVAALFVLLVVAAGITVHSAGHESATKAQTVSYPQLAGSPAGPILVGRATAKARLDVYEDFQCPWCGEFERAQADTIAGLVTDGTLQVAYHPMAFLGEESRRAANAAGCAADLAGADGYAALHRALYDHQPQEGTGGYTTADLITAGTKIDALNTPAFAECVTAQRMLGWGDAITEDASKKGINATPTLLLNGRQITDKDTVFTPAKFTAAVTAAAK